MCRHRLPATCCFFAIQTRIALFASICFIVDPSEALCKAICDNLRLILFGTRHAFQRKSRFLHSALHILAQWSANWIIGRIYSSYVNHLIGRKLLFENLLIEKYLLETDDSSITSKLFNLILQNRRSNFIIPKHVYFKNSLQRIPLIFMGRLFSQFFKGNFWHLFWKSSPSRLNS